MQEQRSTEHKRINGWGVDADLDSRPYHPVHKTQVKTGAHWSRPDKQPMTVEILQSIERGQRPAIFGTANPPRGLSGVLRRYAFKKGEGNFSHWIPLILADRIDFIEGLFEDAIHGKMPRIFGDGYYVDYKYNRKQFYYRVAKNTALVAGAAYLVSYLFRDKKKVYFK